MISNGMVGRPQNGVTLIELLISLVLGLFLVITTLQLYLHFKQSSRAQEASARLAENGRVATELLTRTIRLGGHFGCTGKASTTLLNHLTKDKQGIYGIDGGMGNGVPVPDEITIYHTENEPAISLLDIDDPYNPKSNPDPLSETARIQIGKGSGIGEGDLIVLSDCSRGDVIDITGITTASGTDQLAITGCDTCSHSYDTGSEIRKISQIHFFIRRGTRGGPALYIQTDDHSPQELIEGVENMQIHYGQDTDGDGIANRYVIADVINENCETHLNDDCWRHVSSIHIALLLRSNMESVVTRQQTYYFDGMKFSAPDKRLRREYVNLISLKNRRP